MSDIKNDIRLETQAKLIAWGQWCLSGGIHLDYPEQTPFGRLRGLGNVKMAHMNDEEAQEVDQIISELKNVDPIAREVTILYFLYGKNLRDMEEFGYKYEKARHHFNFMMGWVISRLYECAA